ncbi:pre-mRNA-splicing factor rse1 [Sorochytrium milnesiophthora]
MHLYNITLQPPTHVVQAVVGSFSGASKQQEIVLAKPYALEMVTVDAATGKVTQLLEQNVFGVVRSVAAFRLIGARKDYLVVGSDSGRIVILEYNVKRNMLERVHLETFGKSGCRRIVPGQYLATDPKGRAVMIGAVEKQKMVYVLNRDSAARLTISSPLEAHRSHTIASQMIGVDVGFENPIFACLEMDYGEADQDPTGQALQDTSKMLAYYELDLGLNHVIRKWADPVPMSAHLLIQVPGGSDGPSGVIVCSENVITWKHQGHADVHCPIPRRINYLEDQSRGLMLTCAVTHKMKQQFFILAQSEEGDLYKITLEHNPADGEVTALRIKYFDSLPQVANSLIILKSGYLLTISEFGNHFLYSIDDLGDNEEEPQEYSSVDYTDEEHNFNGQLAYFQHRDFKNITPVDVMESMAPVMDAQILNLTDEDTPQLYALCGRGARSSFRILRHGLEATELAATELPANPNGIWTLKSSHAQDVDAYIVVSFLNDTVVLGIGETLEEVTNTGILANVATIAVAQFGEEDLVQVHATGVRHIRAGGRVNDWRTPQGRVITHAATNNRQVLIALNSGELVYFELETTGILTESPDRKQMTSQVTCLDIGTVPEGRLRCRFAAVGCADNTVRVLGLDPDNSLEGMSMQALNSVPESLCITEMMDMGADVAAGTMYLNIGLQNGVLIRSTLDDVNGALSDSRLRFVGAKSPRLVRIRSQGLPAMLCLSTRPWLNYTYQGRTQLTPITYEALECASSFRSEQCPEGIVASSRNTLRILSVDKLGKVFNQATVDLSYTPRRQLCHPMSRHFIVLESDSATFSPQELESRLKDSAQEFEDESIVNYAETFPAARFGHIHAPPQHWASCIRVLNPFDGSTVQRIDLEDNEAAFSLAFVQFAVQPHELFLVVGTAKELTFAPMKCKEAFLHTYKFIENGTQLELVHKTPVEDLPLALLSFQGRLLAAVGKLLRIYDLGKKKMLRKYENKQIGNRITQLSAQGNRILIGDIQDSFCFATYRYQDSRIVVFADDKLPRWVTCGVMLDFETIAGGDKFGNFFVLRLPGKVSDEIEDDPTGNRVLYEKGYLNGAPHKLDSLCEYHVEDAITSLQRTSLVPGGREILVYTTFGGGVGAFVPFISKDDYDFFQTLEMHMRQEAPPLCGRDHLQYRSYHVPVKSVIDGDLCELYNNLPPEKRRAIAEDMDRSTAEVAKKLEDIRTRVAF